MVRIPTKREPTHPGEVLRAEFLEPMGVTPQALAEGIRMSPQWVSEFIAGTRGVTPGLA